MNRLTRLALLLTPILMAAGPPAPDKPGPSTLPDKPKLSTVPDKTRPSTMPDKPRPATMPDKQPKPTTAPDKPKPPTIAASLRRHDEAVAAARAALDKAVSEADRQLLADLKAAKDAAVLNHNANEIMRADAATREAQAGMRGPPPPGEGDALRDRVIREREFQYLVAGGIPKPVTRVIEFLPGGMFGRGGGSGWEQLWAVQEVAGRPFLVIAGDAGPMELAPTDDGGFRGVVPRVPGTTVTLTPLRPPKPAKP